MTEEQARALARRAVDRLGGIEALEGLYTEPHTPSPEQEVLVDQERVFVRLREPGRPAIVLVGPFTFEIRDGRLVSATAS